jgi:hypothetical protein
MKPQLFLPSIIIVAIFSCNKVASYGKYNVYRKLDDPSTYILVVDGDPDRYSYKAKLNIDIKTLEDLGEFLVDKNHVYTKYETDGVTLILALEEADRATFRVMPDSQYAKDKSHVFHYRNGITHSSPQ